MTDLENSMANRIAQIRSTLPDRVRLIAVSKTVGSERIREAYRAGIRDFGESRIPESLQKQEELKDLTDITWHLIGHLQSNKAKKAIANFPWIHSVDSLKLAQQLNELAENLETKPKICLQVKIVPDPQKFGWRVPELLNDLPVLDRCDRLDIQGLMCIPPFGLNSEQTYEVFQQTAELADKIKQQDWSNLQMHHLSMGMSADYPLAIQAGATLIRLGTTLFGQRNP
ncbi:MAG: YggS family pyridoxal phosphate-dependent enzyme [Roseofilum sp. SBFL]|uniref:YggS family pyridoxal phosphate-dependent enzyme n=1 Tax=unclassified Roseofilum TaxID=2620099 RepID=UPI001AFE3920|nr:MULTISPECIES: YggS family pyridoxal phosphate-dependent enzyme [unclassified Roseofilum]MBP0015651.1 YggS family pyridoxal phosphate-dependent enzyme [Roseofilum sp. SID3]MBP0022566.1 YggS family pyridoxal phosphate-dependent enzyme [Roseofilum sp. SID2]MBP0036384.1 YggS family pyridoxal phosphate-dependent enzyme [Roseofilum sp. SID1]MBP0044476.1 YggS family pyridoxal phosphate-dependent enzyme [Roseofilum sp. SBFL]